MRVLLDTNSLLWLLDPPDKQPVGTQTKQLLQAADEVYASSINFLEIHIKAMIGKLNPPGNMQLSIDKAGFRTIDFTVNHANALLSFPEFVRHDPFDRMLVAQARAEGLFFVTSDRF